MGEREDWLYIMNAARIVRRGISSVPHTYTGHTHTAVTHTHTLHYKHRLLSCHQDTDQDTDHDQDTEQDTG